MLTETAIKGAKPREAPYKIPDGQGLALLVQPSGSKWWRFRYHIWAKEKSLSLGTYPDVSLKQARERRDAARKLVADGVDPSDVRKRARNAHKDRFAVLAEQWLAEQTLRPATLTKKNRVLKYLVAELGNRPVSKITTPLAFDVLRKIVARGPDVGRDAYSMLKDVMFDAVTLGLIENNPITGLSRKLPPPKRQSHAGITEPEAFGRLLLSIDCYPGQPIVRLALQFLALTFVRPGELRGATWTEIRLEDRVWLVPGDRKKEGRDLFVPLAPQAMTVLELARSAAFRPSPLVFPGLRPSQPLSENTFNVALRTMGYTGAEHVAHGFRTTASSMLNEQLKFPQELRELQLAHARPGVWGTYDRSKLLDERRAMMARWADYLDELRLKVSQKQA